MKVLVTGGAGFIGSHVVELLLEEGHEVVVLDNIDRQVHPSAWWPHYVQHSGARCKYGDVRNRNDVSRALRGCEAVIHLAAKVGVGQSMYEIAEYTSVNAWGTAVLLEEMARTDTVQRLVVASSMSVYGEGAYGFPQVPDGPERMTWPQTITHTREGSFDEDGQRLEPVPLPTPEHFAIKPTSIYAIGKRDQEEMCLVWGAANDVPTTALRFFNTYGRRQTLGNPYTGVVAIFASQILQGKEPQIFEDGLQSRDFIDVRDTSTAVALALKANYHGILNVGTGVQTTVVEVARILCGKLGRDDMLKSIKGTGISRSGDIRHCYADTSEAWRVLAFNAEIPFERGMEDLCEWLQEQELKDDGVDAATALLQKHGLLLKR